MSLATADPPAVADGDLHVLEDLTDAECYLSAILQDHSGLDLAEFCVGEGQLVLTSDGHVPIEDVQPGALVLTHLGRWRRVLAVHDRGVREVVRVVGQGHPGLVMTPDHELYVREARRGRLSVEGHRNNVWDEPHWRSVGDLGSLYHRGSYRRWWWGCPSEIEDLVPPGSFTTGQARSDRITHDPLTIEWLWLYGRYLADGSTSHHGRAGAAVQWSVGRHKAAGVRQRLQAIGVRFSEQEGNNCSERVTTFTTRGVQLVDWLETHGGKLASRKRLSSWVFGLSEEKRRAVLDGYLAGDGTSVSYGHAAFVSTSKELAFGVRVLAATLGMAASVSYFEEYESTYGRGRPFWKATLDRGDGTSVKAVQGKRGVWTAIKSINPAGCARVFDLTVEDDHSFVVEGVVVHNCWYEPDVTISPDGCWRAWPFQWSWWRTQAHLQIDQCARSVGKSLSIQARMFAFPFRHPGQEAVITAPELNHLEPVTKFIEDRFYSSRLGREMLMRGRSAVTHRPFMMNFVNGAKLIGRIPQRDGKGVKGIHPVQLELDEAQDYPKLGWTELNETLKTAVEDSEWRAHGVTRGVRDKFFEYTQEKADNPWVVHRYTALHRPTWTDEERKLALSKYGGHREDPDYRRNVMGLHGDATNPLFVLHRLSMCVDDDKSSNYNTIEYQHFEISDQMIEELGPEGDIRELLPFPAAHKVYKTTWGGMDVGYCVDTETEILTQRGWLRWDEVRVGDRSLGINPTTGCSEWQDVLDVYREDFASIPMVEMRGQSFDALVTPHHKWLVRSESGEWRWRQTRDLTTKDCVPLTVPRADCPVERTFSDDFVELTAWFWTEGWWSSVTSAGIAQSESANPDYVERIRLLLKSLCGDPGPAYWPGSRLARHLWTETPKPRGGVDFRFRGPVVAQLREVLDGKVPSVAFLSALTAEQLELFIETSIDADGWRAPSGARKIEQRSEAGIRSFEIACALAGLSTSTSYNADRDRFHLSILKADTVRPVKAAQFPRSTSQAMTVRPTEYRGTIWCPTVTHHNWLARRNGSVYFTGNTHDPSEILIFAEYHPDADERREMVTRKKACPAKGLSRMKLICRISLKRVSNPDQVKVILAVMDFYDPKAFGLDKTGAGLPLFQDLQETFRAAAEYSALARQAMDRIKGYNFSAKVIVDIDDTVVVDEVEGDPVKDASISRIVLEQSTDVLREFVDTFRWWMPWDTQLISEYEGQTFSYSKAPIDSFGRRRRVFSEGRFHALDASRMVAMAHSQEVIEGIVNAPKNVEPVYDHFISA